MREAYDLVPARTAELLDAGIPLVDGDVIADAYAIGAETRFGRRRVVARHVCRHGTIEIFAEEARSDRLLRSLLADGPVTGAGVHDAAKAIGITDSELESAMRRVGVIERRTARTGRTFFELRSPQDAEPPTRELPDCGHPVMWRSKNGRWLCTTCHPPGAAEPRSRDRSYAERR